MRGTTNTTSAFVNGNALPPNTVDDSVTILTGADDDAFYELFKLEPPAGASATNVRHGFSPLRSGPFVTADGATRAVTIKPMRVARSSISNATPRSILTGSTSADTINNTIPAAPGAGLWGYEVLYAQLTWVDSANPTKGTTITFVWGTSPAYVVFANPANFGTIPADTNTSWNIPIAYVRTYNGQTAIVAADLIEVQPLTSGSPVLTVDTQLRVDSMRNGFDVRRAYSSVNQDPTKLVSGSTSNWVGLGKEATLTQTITPIVVGRRNVENVRREIILPRCAGTLAGGSAGGTAGTGAGVTIATLVLDDTRDWRGGNFSVEMWVSNTNAQKFGEDAVGALGDPRTMPNMGSNGSLYFKVCGQTHVAYTPHAIFGSRLWAAVFGRDVDLQGIGTRNGLGAFFLATEGWGIFADPTTGALMWSANRGGTGDGPPVWILLDAWFGNHLLP